MGTIYFSGKDALPNLREGYQCYIHSGRYLPFWEIIPPGNLRYVSENIRITITIRSNKHIVAALREIKRYHINIHYS
ncbi:hypothetical protein UFOVP1_30 [uncultured Caudovirales phage]|uniref:Uncharacterized protein n=1 Tax=uncultured Caudovirales phage TaxID=2100421 RepID=A0A6J5KHD9_9CAUD|nr:hypothetical protein UFOVP1_30 [uncultured Caudovirales phage]